MCPFDADSKITQLKCNPQHYFHDECIERWVKEGNNSCPHCRAPIEDVDRIRAMMEGGEWEFSEEYKKSEKKSQLSKSSGSQKEGGAASSKSNLTSKSKSTAKKAPAKKGKKE